jgi:hypothetical protein
MSRENKGNRRGNNPIFFQLNLVLLLEHVAAKLHDFAENNVLQSVTLARSFRRGEVTWAERTLGRFEL